MLERLKKYIVLVPIWHNRFPNNLSAPIFSLLVIHHCGQRDFYKTGIQLVILIGCFACPPYHYFSNNALTFWGCVWEWWDKVIDCRLVGAINKNAPPFCCWNWADTSFYCCIKWHLKNLPQFNLSYYWWMILGCLSFGSIINNVDKKSCTRLLEHMCVDFSRFHTQEWKTWVMGRCVFNSSHKVALFSKMVLPIYITQQHVRVPLPYLFPDTWYLWDSKRFAGLIDV